MPSPAADILIISDIPALSQAIRPILAEAGHRITEARASQDALRLAHESACDLILVDASLPDAAASVICRQIRADARISHMGILLIADKETGASYLRESLSAGADDYVTYPMSDLDLICRVNVLLRLHRTAAELQGQRSLASRLMETSPISIVAISLEGKVTYANASAIGLLGPMDCMTSHGKPPGVPWQVTDLAGNPLPAGKLIHQRVLDTKGPITDVRHILIWPNGRRRIVAASGAPITSNGGQIVSVLITMEDITEQLAHVDHIARLNQLLEASHAIDQVLVRVRDRQELIQQVCQVLVTSHVATSSWIALTDADGRPTTVATAGSTVSAEELIKAWAESTSDTGLEEAFAAEETAIAHNLPHSHAPGATSAAAPSQLAVTLHHQDQCYGVLTLALPDHIGSSRETRALLEEVAADISFALHDIELDTELQLRTSREYVIQERLRTLVQIGNTFASAASVDELCRQAIELGIQNLGFDRLSIWLRNEDGSDTIRGTWGVDAEGNLHDERHRREPLDLVNLLAWNQHRQSQELHLENIPLDDGEGSIGGIGTRTRALMWDDGTFLGLVSTDNLLTGKPIPDRDQDILGLYATLISGAIIRRRAADALRGSERFYRTLFETTGAATMVLGNDMRPTMVNAKAEAVFGFSATELREKRIAELVEPDDRPTVETRHRARRVDPAGTPGHYEVRMRAKSGEVRNVIIDVNLIPGTDQSIVSVNDITTQRQAMVLMQQRAAQQSALNTIIRHTTVASDAESLLSVTLHQAIQALEASAGLVWVDSTVVAHGVSSEHVDILRNACRPVSEDRPIAVMDWHSLPDETQHSDGQADVKNSIQELGFPAAVCAYVGGNSADLENGELLVADTKSRSWTEAQRKLLEAVGQQIGSAVVRVNLLERVRLEADRLQTVINTVPQGVILLSADHRVLLANPRAQRHLLTLSNAEVGDQLTTLGDRPITDLLTRPAPGSRHQVTAGGRIYEILSQPLTATHSLQGWVILNRDVTEERRIERQQRQQEQLAAVGRLTSGIAHDFNNIIAIIVLYAQMASQQPGLSSRTEEHLQVISNQARRATKLIGQILDFSRSAPLEKGPMDFASSLKEMVKLWQRTLPENIQIDLTYQPGDYTIVADPTRIQQVLMNLAANAHDALPHGGAIHIALDIVPISGTDKTDSTAAETEGDAWIQLQFTDTGTGIAPDVLPYVFEPFFTTKQTGSGLGLAQVQGIIRQHEGMVDIASEVNEGTTVTLYLPTAQLHDRQPIQPTIPAPPPDRGSGETILLAEDNPYTREALLAALEGLNYRTVSVENGKQALDILDAQDTEVDLILSDAIMPELGAHGLLRGLAERGAPHPVIIASGYLQPSEQDLLRTLPNFVEWLSKPVDLADLAASIKKALNGREIILRKT